MDNILDESVYSNIIKKRDVNFKIITQALEIVEQFIAERRLVLVGGMAIDYALRKKGSKIYEDDAVPDYDFLSPTFHKDAYDLAYILHEKKFPNVSVINAMHPSTMRVFVLFTSVADITYIPENLFKILPTLEYGKLLIIHPTFQFIDQHRSLALPYEGAPRETILHRWEKDIKRHQLLYEKYPFTMPLKTMKSLISSKLVEEQFSLDLFAGTCIGGFPGMIYWINSAYKMGFMIDNVHLNEFMVKCRFFIENNKIYIKKPKNYRHAIYSDNIWAFTNKVKKITNIGEIAWYNAVLDKIPRRCEFDLDSLKAMEVYDNNGKLLSARVIYDNIWVANLQTIMCYWLTKYFIEKKDAYIIFYIICKKITNWAASEFYNSSDPDYIRFLPNNETFGKNNWAEYYILYREKMIDILRPSKTKTPRSDIMPKKLYLLDEDNTAEKQDKKYDFIPSKSPIYQFDGQQVIIPFKPLILPDL